MIKGVNHQIIEVRQTGHPYFERALFFVHGAYAEKSEAELTGQANTYLKSADAYQGIKEARVMRWFKRCALVVLGAFIGLAAGILVGFWP